MGAQKDWDRAAGKQMWLDGATDAQIAKALGVTQGAVNYFRRKHWESDVVTADRSGPPETPIPAEADGLPAAEDGLQVESPQGEADPVNDEPEQPQTHEADGRAAFDSDFFLPAVEAAVAGLSGMDAVVTASLLNILFSWRNAEDLRQARQCLDYLIGRREGD